MGKKSPVWEYFEMNAVDARGLFRCNICMALVKASDSSTTNLRHHIRQHHPAQHAVLTAKSPCPAERGRNGAPGAGTCVRRAGAPYQRADEAWRAITEAVVYFIAKDRASPAVVEAPGFRHLLHALDPKYQPPSRAEVSGTYIPKLYRETRERVRGLLADVECFAGTADVWSSHERTPYVGYAVHFVDAQWRLRHVDLGVSFAPQDGAGAGAGLAGAMADALHRWGLDPRNQVCVTTDNGEAVVRAARALGWPRLGCFGHSLHLAVASSYGARRGHVHRHVSRALAMARGVVARFHASWKRKRELFAAQSRNGKDEQALLCDCVSRWGSTQAMIQRLLNNEEEIKQVLGKTPEWREFEVLKSLNRVLEPLVALTHIMSGSGYLSASSVKAVLASLDERVLAEDEPRPESLLANQLRANIKGDLRPRYASEDGAVILDAASFLDPRFKTSYLTPDSADDATGIERVTKCLLADVVDDRPPPPSSASSASESAAPSASASIDALDGEPPRKKRATLGSWLGRKPPAARAPVPAQMTKVALLDEIHLYRSMSGADADQDPLEWWRGHARELPLLARLARRYLCVQASSSPSERLFGEEGHGLAPGRARLDPHEANALTFLAANL